MGECRSAVVNGDPATLERAIRLGLPVHKHVFGSGTYTPLHYAVYAGTKPSVIAVLLAAGADVNARSTGETAPGQTPLMLAAYAGRPDLVKQLLAAGADVALKTPVGVSALAYAGWGGKTTAYAVVLRELLAAGARTDAEALTAAARHGSPEMVRALVAAGADVNEFSRWGTALHLAVDEGRADTAEALLAAGADPNLRVPAGSRNYPGQTALDLARERKRKKLVALLEAASTGRRPPAVPSKPSTPAAIPEVWKRLEKALGAAAPAVKKSLKRGAHYARLAALEATLGLLLPSEVRASYLLHDGQKGGADGLLPEGFAGLDAEYELLSVAGILAEWKPWKELLDEGEFAGQTATPDAGVRAVWWDPAWVPIASDGGGNSVCIDLSPARGGKAGQVILMSHESGDRPRLAGSFSELLAGLAEHYEEKSEDD